MAHSHSLLIAAPRLIRDAVGLAIFALLHLSPTFFISTHMPCLLVQQFIRFQRRYCQSPVSNMSNSPARYAPLPLCFPHAHRLTDLSSQVRAKLLQLPFNLSCRPRNLSGWWSHAVITFDLILLRLTAQQKDILLCLFDRITIIDDKFVLIDEDHVGAACDHNELNKAEINSNRDVVLESTSQIQVP
ncbi:hypothetical protein MRB53_036843 [Persea americana]|nr:hypothetical protein MRB53_036843 [Persea americana]